MSEVNHLFVTDNVCYNFIKLLFLCPLLVKVILMNLLAVKKSFIYLVSSYYFDNYDYHDESTQELCLC